MPRLLPDTSVRLSSVAFIAPTDRDPDSDAIVRDFVTTSPLGSYFLANQPVTFVIAFDFAIPLAWVVSLCHSLVPTPFPSPFWADKNELSSSSQWQPALPWLSPLRLGIPQPSSLLMA